VINRRDKSRLNNLKDALTGIGGLEVNAYGPAIFRQHRDQVASTGTRSARQVNDLMQFMRRIVKWGAEKGFCKPEVWTNLGIVKRLDRSDIPIEPKTIKPANHDDVIATMQHLKDTPWAIIRLLMLTGARPSEIVSLRRAKSSRMALMERGTRSHQATRTQNVASIGLSCSTRKPRKSWNWSCPEARGIMFFLLACC